MKDQVYTGATLKPVVTVKNGATTLKEGTDYTVAYRNNTAIGTAAVTVTGQGDYTGTATATFAIKPISLSKCKITVKDQTWNGKVRKPAPVVKYGKKTLEKGTDYTVSYKNSKNVGTATVTVTGIGKYGESVSKTFKINPKAVALSKLTAGKRQLTVTWKKGTGITGYEVQYGQKRSFAGAKKVAVKGDRTLKKVLGKLKSEKVYYVRIRAYKTVNGTKLYSAWSKAVKKKTK